MNAERFSVGAGDVFAAALVVEVLEDFAIFFDLRGMQVAPVADLRRDAKINFALRGSYERLIARSIRPIGEALTEATRTLFPRRDRSALRRLARREVTANGSKRAVSTLDTGTVTVEAS